MKNKKNKQFFKQQLKNKQLFKQELNQNISKEMTKPLFSPFTKKELDDPNLLKKLLNRFSEKINDKYYVDKKDYIDARNEILMSALTYKYDELWKSGGLLSNFKIKILEIDQEIQNQQINDFDFVAMFINISPLLTDEIISNSIAINWNQYIPISEIAKIRKKINKKDEKE